MVPWNKNFSIHKSLVEEVENTNSIGDLKQIARTIIKENHILCHRTKVAFQSINNLKTLVKYLQATLTFIMAKKIDESKKLWSIVTSETLRAFDTMIRYQMLIYNLSEHSDLNDLEERRILKELHDATTIVPYNSVRVGRDRCVRLLSSLNGEDPEDSNGNQNSDSEENAETQTAQRKKIRAVKYQNVRVNDFKSSRRQQYRIKAKRNACKTSRKQAFNKTQSIHSESNAKKYSNSAKLAKSQESSPTASNDNSMKTCRSRRLKRKTEMRKDYLQKLVNEQSGAESETPIKQAEPNNKKMKKSNNDSISNPTNESYQIKELEIKVSDFMSDSFADNDPYIAQFKKTLSSNNNEARTNDSSKMSTEEEFQIVDDMDDDNSDDQKSESDSHNNDDESVDDDDDDDDDNSFKSPESEDDTNTEDDSTVTEPIAASCEERSETRNTIQNESKGPHTPPPLPSPVLTPVEECRRESNSPSVPSPVIRGPHTPPGLAPTSDSEDTDDEVSSDSSTISTAY